MGWDAPAEREEEEKAEPSLNGDACDRPNTTASCLGVQQNRGERGSEEDTGGGRREIGGEGVVRNRKHSTHLT